ncbi:hypothetical protein C9439_05215 [archaeon SCG-AAA382B04]|nr:hypothetical protein C9439_05215 [archaeon SCG-AAA382B04]
MLIKTDNKPSIEEIPKMAKEKEYEVVSVDEIGDTTWLIKIKK